MDAHYDKFLSKKTLLLIKNILITGCFLLTIGCSKSDNNNDEPIPNPPDKTESTVDMLIGNWLLTELKENGENSSLDDGSYVIYSITSDNNITKYSGVDLTKSTYETTCSGEWNYNFLRSTLTIILDGNTNSYKIGNVSNNTLTLNDNESSDILKFRKISKSDVPTNQYTPNTNVSEMLIGAWKIFGCGYSDYGDDVYEEIDNEILCFWKSDNLHYFSRKENNPQQWEIDFTLKWDYNPISGELTIPVTDANYDSYDYFHVCGTESLKISNDILRLGDNLFYSDYKKIPLYECPDYESYIKSTWSRYDISAGEFEYIIIYDTSDRLYYSYTDLATDIKVNAWGTYVLTMNYLTFNLTKVEIENADEMLDFKTGETTQRAYKVRYLDTEGIMDMYCPQTGTKRFERK